MLMILIVWILALAITCPPILGIVEIYSFLFDTSEYNGNFPPIFRTGIGFELLGWYEPGRRDLFECRYNENKGYVVFSAMGMQK
jgi:hypothetical protein